MSGVVGGEYGGRVGALWAVQAMGWLWWPYGGHG